MGFGQGLSGLKAASENLDVIGNNISNSKTVGFKAATVAFADVYASSRVGLGVQVAEISQRFTTGNVSTTGNQFDMAIDGDTGFFLLTDSSGAKMYSRNGQFHADKNFNIVNAQGNQLMGFKALEDGTVTNEVGPVTVPVGNIDPQATTKADVRANFDSRSKVLDVNDVQITTTGTAPNEVIRPAIDITDTKNHTHSLPMTVYDSLGNPHQLTQYFVKVQETAGGNSEWNVFYKFDDKFLASATGTVPGTDGTPTTAGVPSSGSAVADRYVNNENLLQHKMVFDPAGRLVGPYVNKNADDEITSVLPYSLTVTGIGANGSPAEPLIISMNYDGSTQFGGEFSPKFTQDGYSTGEYSSMEIAKNGDIIANYTNGETKRMGAIALADFNNLNGLKPIGGNAWIETSESGEALLGRPGTNGLATLQGQAVEESNVDMSEELVNMIIAQRTYQANAQTIKTQDQILQTLITLR